MPQYAHNPQTGEEYILNEQTNQWEPVPADQGFSFGQMVRNIPESAMNYGEAMMQPLIHPISTAKAVGGMGKSIVNKLAEELTQALPDNVVEFVNKANNFLVDLGVPLAPLPETAEETTFTDTEAAERLGELVKDRYGSMAAFKKTLQKDPVGVLADVSAILSVGAAAAPTRFSHRSLQQMGAFAEPLNLVKNVTKATVGKAVPKSVSQKLYQGAAKFGTTIPADTRGKITQTALDQRIMPTPAGMGKLQGMINQIDGVIDSMVDTATQQGKLIPKKAVFTHLKELRKKLGGAKIEGAKDLRVIDRVAKEFDTHMRRIGKNALTPTEMQAFKRDVYQRINFDRKLGRLTPAKEQVYKEVARGAKESVEQAVPGIKEANRQLGDLLELQDPLMRSSQRIANRNPVGIMTPLNVGAGGVAGGPAGAVGGGILSAVSSPRAQAGLGILLNQLQNRSFFDNLMASSIPLTQARIGLLQAGRLNEE